MTQEQCVNCWGLAIINKNSLLSIFAGDKALSRIKSSGLNASDIKVVAGAAGGPKWLVLHGLDQFFFGQWLTNTDSPIHLIGSSIGAWRYAAYCRTDFKKSFKQFEDVYFSQQYTKKPDKQEITEQLDQILDCIFSDAGVDEILSNKHFKLNLFADRGKGLLNREHPAFLIPGLLLTTACNYFSRQTLELFFRRTLFHHPDSLPPFYHMNDFATDTVALSHENLRLAVLASGAIPLVVNGVNNIPGAKPGYYRDGGLIDYHMSIPYGVDDGIVLLPHFSKTIYPGWLDKFAGSRKPDKSFLENVLMVAPSESFIESLPLSKIPDRSDFKRFVSNDKARIQYWTEVTKRSEELPQVLQQWIEDGNLIEHIQTFS